MPNPWMKKNPLLSLMLSGANAWTGAARGIMAGQAGRQRAQAARTAAQAMTAFWTGGAAGGPKGKAPSRKRGKRS
ncbi:hypothetical protein [Roseomonas sp. KE0001]|uniref:hypothetical protein n=1 Tax=Roseomonas sp. KE0001 TaxID=2479201 RepID=UPI0018DFE2ED|nr:hypothetical protein [Roseomonas sp. KE0001]